MRTSVIGQIWNYIKFRTKSKPKGGHGIHSPFVYKLYTEIIEPSPKDEVFEKIERYRNELKKCGLSIIRKSTSESVRNGYSSQEVPLSRIASNSSVPAHIGQLLFRLSKEFKPEYTVELGTSVGISTMYIAAGNPNGKVYTIEKDDAVLEIAQNRFRQLGFNNINTLSGDFDIQLKKLTEQLPKVDLIYIDGDHNGKSLIDYINLVLPKVTETSIIIVDDIRWSYDMEIAWKIIRSKKEVSISIDLFRCGILLFNKGITKQHFMLRFGPY